MPDDLDEIIRQLDEALGDFITTGKKLHMQLNQLAKKKPEK